MCRCCKRTCSTPGRATVTRILRETYHPYVVWYPLAAIGLVSTIGLFIFARMAARGSDMNK